MPGHWNVLGSLVTAASMREPSGSLDDLQIPYAGVDDSMPAMHIEDDCGEKKSAKFDVAPVRWSELESLLRSNAFDVNAIWLPSLRT